MSAALATVTLLWCVLTTIGAQHPLRYVWKGVDHPCQVVWNAAACPMNWIEHDLQGFSFPDVTMRQLLAKYAAAARATLHSIRLTDCFTNRDRAQGFDMAAPPLMRFTLFRLPNDVTVFCWTSHHITMDGWSLPLLLHDVFGGTQDRAAPKFQRYVVASNTPPHAPAHTLQAP